MKKCIYLFLILFSSCAAPKVIALRGNYPQTPMVFYSDKSFDKVWDNIIDMFAQRGLSIRIIDRTSGLIISDKSKLTWSFENKAGVIEKPQAFVVLERIMQSYEDQPYRPTIVTGEWNIRIKQMENKTSINVNLTSIQATYGTAYYSSVTHSVMTPVDIAGKTTGVFENNIYEIIK